MRHASSSAVRIDRNHPNSLDNAACNYINTHGKNLDGEPLGKYWLHGLGHMGADGKHRSGRRAAPHGQRG